jgi:hypothetical protein
LEDVPSRGVISRASTLEWSSLVDPVLKQYIDDRFSMRRSTSSPRAFRDGGVEQTKPTGISLGLIRLWENRGAPVAVSIAITHSELGIPLAIFLAGNCQKVSEEDLVPGPTGI